jgi:tagaturonate reductase
VVVPCELIEDNGAKLKAIVRAHAERWGLDARFGRWLDTIPFCDTLVDRIVPGAPKGAEAERLRETLGYDDGLVTTCEPYRLFAIRGDAALKARLGFADADPGIVVADDITPFRELKVRLLNGTHTAFVPAALLAGCETVREAVEHPLVGRLVQRLMFDEIAPTVPADGAEAFAKQVLDRFANPFIRHALVDITLQATMKTRVRLVPTILRYAARTGGAPPALAFGIAAYLLHQRDTYSAHRRADDQAEPVRRAWAELGDDEAAVVRRVLSDAALWETDLTTVPGLGESVTASLISLRRDGAVAAAEAVLAEPVAPV